LTISKLNRTILGCDRCSTRTRELETSEAEARAVIALEVAMRGQEGDESFEEEGGDVDGREDGEDGEEEGENGEDGEEMSVTNGDQEE
jgi:hypothetical protein